MGGWWNGGWLENKKWDSFERKVCNLFGEKGALSYANISMHNEGDGT